MGFNPERPSFPEWCAGAYYRTCFALSHKLLVHGVSVAAILPDEKDHTVALPKLRAAIELIHSASPRDLAMLSRYSPRIWLSWAPSTRLAWWHDPSRMCIISHSYVCSEHISTAEIAATLIHEATHARLYRWGIRHTDGNRANVERLCFKAELWFATRLPDGNDIADRARRQLARDPSFWSREAVLGRMERELREAGLPPWLARFLVRLRARYAKRAA